MLPNRCRFHLPPVLTVSSLTVRPEPAGPTAVPFSPGYLTQYPHSGDTVRMHRLTERRNEQTTLTHPAPISNLYVLMKIFWYFLFLMNFLKNTQKLYFEIIFDSLEVAKVVELCVLLPLLLSPATLQNRTSVHIKTRYLTEVQ